MIFYGRQDKAVLLFHRILPERDPMWDPIDPVLFDQTLGYIKRKFHIISLHELLFGDNKYAGKPLAALTFDDGYRDFITCAIPVMEKHQLTASMFVVTDCIEENKPTWTFIVDYLFSNSSKMKWDNVRTETLPEKFRNTNWGTEDEKINYCRQFKQYMKWIPASTRDSFIKSLEENFSDTAFPRNLMMTWNELRELQQAGFEIGSHSVTHATLATVESDKTVEYELSHSAACIKENIGHTPLVFSYPIGSYNAQVKELTEKAGYRAALAVNKTTYNPGKQDMFEIPRIELYNETWLKTRMRINGTVSFLNKFRR